MLTELLYYNLKVAALIAVFYLFYMLLLARETTHTLNRFVLLASIVLSAVLPLCIITIHKTLPQPLPVGEGSIYPLSELAADDVTIPFPHGEGLRVGLLGVRLLTAILLTGTLICFLRFARGCRKLNRIIRSGEMHTLPSGARVSVVKAPFAPFSWMHTVVMSRKDWQSDSAPILAHEEAHVRHRHSYDIVVVEILTALQWFNPVVWYLRQELRTLHEYEADASVLSRGFNESQYIHLLMQKATGIQACAIANSIHTPKTKKRIFMMLKTKSKRTAWLKALYIVPIVLASLTMTAKTVVDYETAEPEITSAVRVFTDQKRGDAYQIRHQPGVRFFRNGVEEQIPEGRSIALEVSKTTLQVNGKPIDQITLSDVDTGALKEIHLTELGAGKFVCNMVTDAPKGKTVYVVDGEMTSEEAVSSLHKEDIANVDVINNKEWCMKYDPEAENAVIICTKQQSDDKVFDIVEHLPHFPGGDAKLMEFIAKNIKYPKQAEENNVQGRVLVRFIVEKDGSLTYPEVVATSKGIGEATPIVVVATMTEKERQEAETHNAGVQALRAEAIRVVNAMPKWMPGRQQGKPVRCRYTIPVIYRLQ